MSKEQYARLLEKYMASNGDTFGGGTFFEPYKYKTDIKYFGP